MFKNSRYNLVLLFSISCLLLAVFVIEFMAMRHNRGTLSYPLDDTFIHMEVARNIAEHGVWGMNPQEFGSASSSILYTLLLAVSFLIFSAHTAIPLIINIIAGILLLMAIDKWLRKQGISNIARLAIHLLVLVIIPLPVIVIIGMEHTLQCLFAFLFVYRFADWLETVKQLQPAKIKLPWQLIALAALCTTIRFEGIFLVALICLILLLKKRIIDAFVMGFIALLPVILFGVYSVSKGSYFLPNSVLLKSEGLEASASGMILFIRSLLLQKLTNIDSMTGAPGVIRPGISLLATQQILFVVPILYLLFRKKIAERSSYKWLLIIILSITLIHLAFAATGWFYRYEAYLLVLALPVVAVIISRFFREKFEGAVLSTRVIAAFLAFILLFPVFFRSLAAIAKPVRASINIYEQQYQMATFINRYYKSEVLAFNDIGAVSYFSDGKSLDLWGLGSIEMAKSKKGKYYTPSFIDSSARGRGVRFAIVYDSWFPDSLLHRWKKVATWQIEKNVICGSDTVSFYVLDDSIKDKLVTDLHSFESSLPATVRVRYY